MDFKSLYATNKSSQFKEWRLKLRNGATLTGIVHRKASRADEERHRKPLLVGLHGGTCSAYTFDISPEYTASINSDYFDVPFVAFNRPNFLGSSGWLVERSSEPATQSRFEAIQGLTYFQEEARWYHELIFPVLWEEFAVPNGCSSIVTISHSMTVPISIIASTIYSEAKSSTRAEYVWAGMVLYGLAHHNTETFTAAIGKLSTNQYDASQLPIGQSSELHTPPFIQEDKEQLMLGPPGIGENALRPLIWQQNTPLFIGEVMDLSTTWPQSKQRYKAVVRLPVYYGLGEHDWIWQGTKANVESFVADFTASPSVESALVEGAPHAIELSQAGQGWWRRAFEWAIEVDASN